MLTYAGEYSESPEDIAAAVDVIKEGLGPLPFFTVGADAEAKAEAATAAPAPMPTPVSVRPAILADGTYATQVCLSVCFHAPLV